MTNIPKIKLQLEKQLQELTERAEKIDDDLTALGDDDWQEAAAESAADEVLEEVGDTALEDIAQIKKALARIAADKYGQCSKCGDDISTGRMEALPYATLCIKCAD